VWYIDAADAVKGYVRNHQAAGQSQNAALAVNNTDPTNDRIVKSVVRIQSLKRCTY